MDGKALDGLIRTMCGDHLASQMTRVSLGERTLLSPKLCKQCKDTPLEGIFLVIGNDGKSHCEPLCMRCAFVIVPHRRFFGVEVVSQVKQLMTVTREASNWMVS